MNFANYLTVNAQKIDLKLDEILSGYLTETKKLSPKLVPLVKAFISCCQGGKRIRGVLVKLGYEIAKGQKSEEIYKVGAALEILHTAILVHDDIMDKSPTRRGKPSLYTSVGQDLAIALGDLGFFLSLQIISQSNFPAVRKNQALKLFSKTMVDTAVGQIMDIAKADPMIVAKLKTAQYTILGPLTLGCILGRWGPFSPRLGGIKEFGENLGVAFQIQDDILDGESDRVDVARKKALQYVSWAKRVIPKITGDTKMRRLLEEMTEYMVERKQ